VTAAWLGPRALSDAAGVSTDTLRHYERLGLLSGTARTAAGYRRYPPAALERVRLIQRALAVGFSLDELASALGQRERGDVPCRRVRALVGARLDALEARLRDLRALRDEMRVVLKEWDARLAATPPGQPARLLDMLAAHPALTRGARPRAAPKLSRRGLTRTA
jgi:MerR family transcriptional regulator, Zn(II)-responsive regulator of zntA